MKTNVAGCMEEARYLKKPSIGKKYFKHMNLEAIVLKYPYGKNLPHEDISKESQIWLALIDLLRRLVDFDPAKRWSPFHASKHTWTCSFSFNSLSPLRSVDTSFFWLDPVTTYFFCHWIIIFIIERQVCCKWKDVLWVGAVKASACTMPFSISSFDTRVSTRKPHQFCGN